MCCVRLDPPKISILIFYYNEQDIVTESDQFRYVTFEYVLQGSAEVFINCSDNEKVLCFMVYLFICTF